MLGRFSQVIAGDQISGLPDGLVRGPETFAWRVRGDGLADEHIRDHDVLWVERAKSAEDGRMVIVVIDDKRVMVRALNQEGDGTVRLESANASIEPMILPAERVQVYGHVVGVLRKY